MPEMSPFGWFHTIMGMAALISGAYTIVRYKIIESKNIKHERKCDKKY